MTVCLYGRCWDDLWDIVMDGNTTATPELQAILATLSKYTNPAGVAPAADLNATAYTSNTNSFRDDSSISTPQPTVAERPNDPRLRPQSRSAAASPKPLIDPATITTWQEGLRCVTKIAAQNAQFAASIRRVGQNKLSFSMPVRTH